ncbi:hypothetical protein Bbelb_343050 [Branchiostoma belcheri]|nr:hypothetical protein Bbelb_343050 [Branchiostoma belcheri]
MVAKTARSAAPPTSAWRILAARHTAEDVNKPFCSHDPKFLHISQRNDCYRRQYYIGDQYRQQSFFLRTIRDWNCLPAEVILSPTLDSFKDKILTLPLPSH